MPSRFEKELKRHRLPGSKQTISNHELREAMNALSIGEGLILANEDERELTFEGARIRILPVWKWLCMESRRSTLGD